MRGSRQAKLEATPLARLALHAMVPPIAVAIRWTTAKPSPTPA